ncbi:uncharacterized protein LOC115778849 [Archocentrus centrarchus]|uniref:uncharacterized protein LOC115778849 n=1 Tax=Archocentrus centrarchus TaxID=63155 RepID=UPI0011EA508B|nr:uncharacterized protein LOC115778849 [Archocentrus centrarchus]
MGKPQKNPATTATPTPKRTRSECSTSTSTLSPEKSFTDVLDSIDKKLTSLDARLALVEVLHKEFQQLRVSLEFSQEQVKALAVENQTLRDTVKQLTDGMTQLTGENKKMRETILDIQARSMRDNLVFSGIPEQAEEDAEASVREFLQHQLKLPSEAVKNITFHRVHRLGGKKPDNKWPRPIVAKFEHYKQKEQVRSRGRELRGTHYSVNEQFPKEILDRRRVLFPIRKKYITEGVRATVAVDKLYVNGQLYRDREVTPWLY